MVTASWRARTSLAPQMIPSIAKNESGTTPTAACQLAGGPEYHSDPTRITAAPAAVMAAVLNMETRRGRKTAICVDTVTLAERLTKCA